MIGGPFLAIASAMPQNISVAPLLLMLAFPFRQPASVQNMDNFHYFSHTAMDNSINLHVIRLFYVDNFVDIVDKSVINPWITSYN